MSAPRPRVARVVVGVYDGRSLMTEERHILCMYCRPPEKPHGLRAKVRRRSQPEPGLRCEVCRAVQPAAFGGPSS